MIVRIEKRHWVKGARRSLHDCAVGLAVAEAIGPQADLKVVPSQGVFLNDHKIGTIGNALFHAIKRWDETGQGPRGVLFVELWPEPLNVEPAEPAGPAEPMMSFRHGHALSKSQGVAVDWPVTINH